MSPAGADPAGDISPPAIIIDATPQHRKRALRRWTITRRPVSPGEVAGALHGPIGVVREQAARLDAVAVTVTWRTATGEVTIDYRPDDWLRITLAGDGPERMFVLTPEWEEEP